MQNFVSLFANVASPSKVIAKSFETDNFLDCLTNYCLVLDYQKAKHIGYTVMAKYQECKEKNLPAVFVAFIAENSGKTSIDGKNVLDKTLQVMKRAKLA